MNIEKRIIAFVKLGGVLRSNQLKSKSPILSSSMKEAIKHNGWFTEENVLNMIEEIGNSLEEKKIREWIDNYSEAGTQSERTLPKIGLIGSSENPVRKDSFGESRRVGVIMAGNIPMVGFHDFMCVLMSGNKFIGKLSSDDKFLLPGIAKMLTEIEPEFSEQILFTDSPIRPVVHSEIETEKQKNEKQISADTFIATGSSNTARYFEYYFKNHPHIIRKNRNSIAILDGNESEEDLKNLGKDIFQYFGLGCRNISKIYVPEKYTFEKLFLAITDFRNIIQHNKYANNYNYYRSIYLMNKDKFWDNDFLMLKEEEKISSPVGTLYYERYKNENDLLEKLEKQKENIQCIVSNNPLPSPLERVRVRSGQTQSPELWDYADGVDTMAFLLNL